MERLLTDVAAECAERNPQDGDSKLFTVFELHWFRKNAYNLGVLKCETWDVVHIIRIFNTCLAFSCFYPTDFSASDDSEIAIMAMRCHFIVSSALISLARTEDKIDQHLQHYLEARRAISHTRWHITLSIEASTLSSLAHFDACSSTSTPPLLFHLSTTVNSVFQSVGKP